MFLGVLYTNFLYVPWSTLNSPYYMFPGVFKPAPPIMFPGVLKTAPPICSLEFSKQLLLYVPWSTQNSFFLFSFHSGIHNKWRNIFFPFYYQRDLDFKIGTIELKRVRYVVLRVIIESRFKPVKTRRIEIDLNFYKIKSVSSSSVFSAST